MLNITATLTCETCGKEINICRYVSYREAPDIIDMVLKEALRKGWLLYGKDMCQSCSHPKYKGIPIKPIEKKDFYIRK